MTRDPRIIATIAVLLSACQQPDARVGAAFHSVLDMPPDPITALDILFVIDDSGSMAENQQAVITSARDSLFAQLVDETGAMPDLHVAVVSTSVVTDDLAGICDTSAPQNGLFQTSPQGVDCGIDGSFLVDVADGAGGRSRNFAGDLADTFGCISALGIDGCGFERPLDAIRLALDGSHPENAGFLRNDALLLIVFVTDEDDCSVVDNSGLFGAATATLADPLGPLASFRCFEFGVVCDDDDPRAVGDKAGCVPRDDSAYMIRVDDQVERLRGMKADPSMVMVAGIFGDAAPVVVEPDPELVGSVALRDLCEGEASAYPAVRLHAFADAFPARYTFGSICDPDMGDHLRRVARTAAGVMNRDGCLLGNPLPATCRGVAVAPDGARRPIDVHVATDAACDYTPSGLRADVADVAPGEHLVVECLTAD